MKQNIWILGMIFVTQSLCAQDNTLEVTNPTPWWSSETVMVEQPGQEVILDLLRANAPGEHPRLLLNKALITQMLDAKERSPFVRKAYQDVIRQAEKVLSSEPQSSPLKRHVTADRIMPLGLAYHLTGERKYFDRAWREMTAVIDNEKWYGTAQDDFLSLGYNCKGIALGYDWFYNQLTSEQRSYVRKAIIDHALNIGKYCYQHPSGWEYAQSHWLYGKHNWTPTCNGYLTLAALAIWEDAPELSSYVIAEGLKYIGNYLTEFAPDGAWKEGPMYWYYATGSLAVYMRTLEDMLKNDFGIARFPGLSRTALFPIYMSGPCGIFNFADSGPNTQILSAEISYFCNKYQIKEWAESYTALMLDEKVTCRSEDLLYFDYSLLPVNPQVSLPLSERFGRIEGFSFRGAWNDENTMFLAAKGGFNREVHGTLSSGSFVLDADGERWIHQLGADNYSSIDGYWDYRDNGRRWTFYRCRAEGQNSFVINPDSFPDQWPGSISKLVEYKSNGALPGGYGIIDLSQAYVRNAISAQRGFWISNDAKTVVLQDEIKMKKKSEVYMFFHTKADITISADKKSALLTQNGKHIRLTLITKSKNAVFFEMPAQKLSTSPHPQRNVPELDNTMYKKLGVKTVGEKELYQAIVFSFITNEPNYVYTPLNQWKKRMSLLE